MQHLIVCLLVLTFCCASCARQPVTQLQVTQRLERCSTPNPMQPIPFTFGEHAGSRHNLKALLENVRRMRLERDLLRQTVECYEAQAPEVQP